MLRRMSQSFALKCGAECYRLDEFVRQYGSQLPQIVQVVKGFPGTSVREAINSGDVLVILSVQNERKILARDQHDRKLCLSRNCDLKVEIIPDNCKGEYDTLDTVLQAGSRYFRVLHDISRYGLQAGDILMFAAESPKSIHSLHCIFVNSKYKDSVDLPKNLNGKFQTLQNHREFFLDEVLKEHSLPVNVRVGFLGQLSAKPAFPGCAKPSMDSIKSIFLEHEFVEETIFAVAPGFRDDILLFPRTLGLTVSRDVSTDVFAHRSTAEKLDKLLQGADYFDRGNRYNMDGIYLSREHVRRFPFEVMTTNPFSFDKPSNSSHTSDRKDGERQIPEDSFRHALNVLTLSQPIINRNNSKQEDHFEKESAPSLPAKQKSSTPSQKRQQNKGSQPEIRKPSMIKNEVDCSCFQIGVQDQTFMWPQTTTVKQAQSKPWSPYQAKEEELVIFPSSSLPTSGILINEERANEATAHASMDSFETYGNLNYVMEATRNYQDTAPPHSDLLLGAVNFEVFCENGGVEPSTRPLPLKKNMPKAANACQSIRPTKQANNRSLPHEATYSDLSDEEIDHSINGCVLLEASSEEREDSIGHDLSDALQKSGVSPDHPYDGQREEDIIRTEQRRHNTDNQKRGLLNTLGRKTKLLRRDASKPERKTNKQASNVLRGQPWISKPRSDDFLDMRTIQNYLEMRHQLSRAQARIHHLENQTFEGTRSTNTKPANDSHAVDTQEKTNTDEDALEKVVKREKHRSYREQQKEVATAQSLRYNEPKETEEIAIHSGRKCKSDENVLPDLSLSESATKTHHRIQPNPDHKEITDVEDELPMDSHHWQDEIFATNDLHYDAAQNEDAHEDKQAIGSKEWHNRRPRGRRGDDHRRVHRDLEKLAWLHSGTGRYVDCLERYCSKEAAKYELKMAILSMTWTEDEWMELSDLIRLKRTKEPAKEACVSLEYHERQVPPSSSHRTDERYLVSCTASGQDSRTPGSHAYVNTDLLRQEAEAEAGDGVFSRAANCTIPENRQMRRKPPIPTPRKGGNSPL